jgi:tetratricopeptide (TPR) repeat protein
MSSIMSSAVSSAMSSAMSADPDDRAAAYRLRGFVLDDMGRHDAAIASARLAARLAARLNPALSPTHIDLSLKSGGLAGSPPATDPSPDSGTMSVEPEGPLARYGLGLAFRQRGDFDEARRELKRSLAGGEDARLAEHALGELDLIAGRFAVARVRYESLLARQEQPRLWNEHGVVLHQSGDVHGAADSYRRALRLDPRYALAYNNLGVALDDLGDHRAAREAFVRASELDPTLIVSRRNLARWLAEQRDPLAALKVLRELVACHPRDAESWKMMATMLQALECTEEARDALPTAIDYRPSHAEARFALAVQGGSPLRGFAPPVDDLAVDDLAVDDLAPLLPEQPPLGPAAARACDDADGYALRTVHGEALERYARARALVDAPSVAEMESAVQRVWQRAALGEARSLCLLGRGADALPILKRAGAVWPHHPEVLAVFAFAAASDAERDPASAVTARSAMLRLLRQDVTSAALLHFAGDAAIMMHDEVLALVFYRRALAQDPARPTARVAIARMLRERGDLLAARLELVAALSAVPNWRDAVLELARVHRDARRHAEARGILVDVLKHRPTDADALQVLIEVLVGEKRPHDARIVVDRVLRHDPDNTGARWFDGVLLAQQSRVRDALVRWGGLAQSTEVDSFVQRARHAVSHAVYGSGAPSDPARVA